MYNNIEATVINNGTTSAYFKLERGVRQGCPLSPYLFLSIIETVANKIRNDKNIKGITINKKEIKINLLADDITLLLTSVESVKNSLNLLKSLSTICMSQNKYRKKNNLNISAVWQIVITSLMVYHRSKCPSKH